MNRFTAGAVLVVVLIVACANPAIDPETRAAMQPAHHLYEIQTTYNAAMAGALQYAEQPRCTAVRVIACHDVAVVAALAAIDLRMVQAFKVARLAAPGDQVAAVSAVRALLAEFQSELLAGRVTP
jgi:hypothetical protein